MIQAPMIPGLTIVDDATPDKPTDRKPRSGGRNGGRPVGSMNKLAQEAVALARRTGRLPHEILLDIARGDLISMKRVDPVTGEIVALPVAPSLEQRIDAAKAAAPYYAPKISTVEVIAGVDDVELNHLIALAATEAGFSLTAGGEGEEGEGSESEAGSDTAEVQQAAGRRRRARLNP